MQKLLFFLRHSNDIDHITAVIWKWATTTDVPAEIVISDTSEVLNDYRIRLLQGLPNVTVHLRDDFLSEEEETKKREYEDSLALKRQLSSLFRLHPRRLRRKIDALLKGEPPPVGPDLYGKDLVCRLLDRTMAGVDRGIIALDWVHDNTHDYLPFAQCVSHEARARGFAVVGLPHGDEPHACRMVRINELNYDHCDIYSKTAELFDMLVAPNEVCARRYRVHLGDRVRVLGSPRYNDEWCSQLRSLLPPFDRRTRPGILKLALFLRHECYPIFWQEVIRTIDLLTMFDDVDLVVVHHTRTADQAGLMKTYPQLRRHDQRRFAVVAGDVPASSIVDWADVVLDLGTSAVFEAVKLGKPVLELEYLHATYTVIADMIPGSMMLCRDHLYDTIEKFLRKGTGSFYDEEDRRRFVAATVDTPDGNVLPRYVAFLKDMLDCRTAG